MTKILLLLTGLIFILSAIMVVTLNNYVLRTLSLILCFIAASVTFLFLKLDFIDLVIVMLCICAVGVLFMFIHMMIYIRYWTISNFLLTSGILFVLLLEISFLILSLSNLSLNPDYFYSNNFFLTDLVMRKIWIIVEHIFNYRFLYLFLFTLFLFYKVNKI